jgi:hypothetical protein
MKDVGVAIIDVYDQTNLNVCYDSLKDKVENLIIISNTSNILPENVENKKFTGQMPFATLRNYAINFFRIKGIKHLFLINSNIKVNNQNVFENAIKTANTFGVWFLLGPASSKLTIEDDENNSVLNLTDDINSDFIYIFNNIVSKVGFFDERYFNTKSLDVLDYIIRLRAKNLYLPNGYIGFIDKNLEELSGNLTKPNYKELSKESDKSVEMSYAYFYTFHKYMPSKDDPKSASNDELMAVLKTLQENYSKKI